MVVKISDIADVQGGLVLSRKEAASNVETFYKYKRLTVRALGEDGYIENSELEDFYSNELLDHALFTTRGSVAVRLVSPMYPAFINEDCENLLVPSQIAVLRVKNQNILMPQYLRLCLAQRNIQEKVQKIERGTAQRTVKIGTITELQIVIPDMKTQKMAVKIDEMSRKRERMYQNLIKQERLLTEKVIENIIGGKIG